MASATPNVSGSVVSLWRYPVKSMMGEELNAVAVTHRGLLGDRVYALVDPSNGKVISAKNPRKWPELFDFRAAFSTDPHLGEKIPPVRITLPDGRIVGSEQENIGEFLSSTLDRKVKFGSTPPEAPSLEEYWPDIEDLDHRDTVTDEAIHAGTFFDFAAVHILTTATIDRLRQLYPQGRFEARRFRPNIVIEPTAGGKSFVENRWVGRTLAIGSEVHLKVIKPCPRCVMTTLAQGDLPKDTGILRTAAQHNGANVGVYASVVQGGTIHRGDTVQLEG